MKIATAPLLHYLTVGARRRLSPHPGFDAEAYLDENPDAAGERFGPLTHFLRSGDRSCLSVDESSLELPQGTLARRLTTPEFVAAARNAAVVIRDSRGYGHLDHEHAHFDHAAEAELKASLRRARASLSQEPLVSVVLPTRDCADVITDAVHSVMVQSYNNFELVIVDDGSDDDTSGVLAEFVHDPRVVHIRHPESRGVAAARNTGLERARGELVAYLDSDRTWRPDFLELMVTFMVSEGHRVGYAMSELTERGGLRGSRFRGMPFSRGALMERNYIDSVALVHERTLLETVGNFDETLRRCVDWELFTRLARVTDFAFLPVIATECDVRDVRTDRFSTEVPPSYSQVVRQRILLDWADVRAALPKRDPALVSVVVVATETAELARTTIDRARATATGPVEFVVVDAHLPDHEGTRLVMSTESLLDTRVHRLTQELPLEVARNVGASLTRGGTLVFMAENAWCEPHWDVPLVEGLAAHSAVQPLVLTNGGAVWSAGLYFLPNGDSVNVHHGLPGDAPEVRGVRDVDATVNACLAVRADRFVEIEGFDPLFMDHLAGGELSLRLVDHTGLAPGCVGSSHVALRNHAGSDDPPRRPTGGLGSLRDNERLQRDLWNARTSPPRNTPRRGPVRDGGRADDG